MRSFEIALPANWDEIINAGKYLDVIKVLCGTYEHEGQKEMALISCLSDLEGKQLGAMLGAANTSQRMKLAEDIDDFVILQFRELVFPALDFILNGESFYTAPLPSINHNGIIYYGPGPRLHDQSGEEWMLSHQQQYLYNTTEDYKHLVHLLAANFHEDRKAFNTENFAAQCDQFMDLPEEVVNGFYLWYAHQEDWWTKKFPWLYPEGSDDANAPDGLEVRDLVFEMAGNKLDAAWDVVKTRSRQDIIYALDRLEEKREDLEARMAKD